MLQHFAGIAPAADPLPSSSADPTVLATLQGIGTALGGLLFFVSFAVMYLIARPAVSR